MTDMVIAVLKCDGDLGCFTKDAGPANGPIADILSDMTVQADAEYGVEAVEVEVVSDGYTLFDIKLNGNSVGYFALKVLSRVFGLGEPVLLEHGVESELADVAERFDHKIYILPLFGAIVTDEPARSNG